MRFTRISFLLYLLLSISAYCAENTTELQDIYVKCVKTGPTNNEIAQNAVLVTLGQNNDYLERLLTRNLEGQKKKRRIIRISRIYQGPRPRHIKKDLSRQRKQTQEEAIKILSQGNSIQDIQQYSEQVQPIVQWVLNSVLAEKLEDRLHLSNSDCWKYVNGVLAAVLPVAVGLLEYFLVNQFSQGGGTDIGGNFSSSFS